MDFRKAAFGIACFLASPVHASPSSAAPLRSPAIMPFAAHYTADWKSINVGTSDIELQPDGPVGHYLYTWTLTARGIFRLVYSDDVIQKSWMTVIGNHVRPTRYRGEQGQSTVSVNFDWENGHARGTSETKPVDLPLPQGAQDVLSIQIEVMQDLQNGDLPKTFQILDKDEIKEFVYTREGSARIHTALGELDTVLVASHRNGGNRVLTMWFAPGLGYIPVQAERSRDGKVEFALRIKTLQR